MDFCIQFDESAVEKAEEAQIKSVQKARIFAILSVSRIILVSFGKFSIGRSRWVPG